MPQQNYVGSQPLNGANMQQGTLNKLQKLDPESEIHCPSEYFCFDVNKSP